MDAGNSVFQQMDPLAYIRSGGGYPVCIQGDTQLIRPKALQQVFHNPFAGICVWQLFGFEGFELQVVVMVHEQFAGSGNFLCRLFEIMHKAVKPFLCVVFFGHAAKADVFAAQDVMLMYQRFCVVENTVHIAVGQDDFQTLPVADFAYLLRADTADGGNLNGFVSDFCDF